MTQSWQLDSVPYVARRARRDDIAALVALLADDDIGSARESPAERAAYEAAFSAIDADPAHVLIVATPIGADTVVDTLQFTTIPGLSRGGATRAQVEGVRVARGHRGAGLGSALLDWVIDEASRRGCALVQLTTDARRSDALRFYERHGFVPSHVGLKLQNGWAARGSNPEPAD
jgi:GNAT superfamily N-acetyltransferase